MDPLGKVALVTGGARRLGRAFSIGLARAGADVVVDYHNSAPQAAETAAEIEAMGRRALTVRADVSSKDDVQELIRAARETFGRLDIIVNSASLFQSGPFETLDEDEWDRVLAVNLKGAFLVSQQAAPLLRAHGAGVIVNIADLSAFQPWPSFAHHAVSKAGLVHLTRVLARALAPEVRSNCIVPGTVLPPEGYAGEDHAGGRERRTLERPGEPGDAVDALLYLVHSDFVTGEVLVVDGGRLLL